MNQCSQCGLEYNKVEGIDKCPSCYGTELELSHHQVAAVLGYSPKIIREIERNALKKFGINRYLVHFLIELGTLSKGLIKGGAFIDDNAGSGKYRKGFGITCTGGKYEF